MLILDYSFPLSPNLESLLFSILCGTFQAVVVTLMCPGLEEKMKALQGMSLALALLAILEASAQVLVAGKCPRPAVVQFFDASRVSTPTFLCY